MTAVQCPRCRGLGWICAGTGEPADGYCCGDSPGCPSCDGCPNCTEIDHGRQAPWIEKGCDLPALHRWASCQLDYLAACSMIVRAGGRRQAAVDAALSAIADRDAALPSALTELRELGPPGTLAPLTLGGRRYGVRCTGLSIELLEPTPQPSEEPCP